MTAARENTLSSHAHQDPDLDFYERQTEEEMGAAVAAASKAGTLRRGGVKATLTDPAALEARVAAAFDQDSVLEAQAELEEARQAGHPIEPLIRRHDPDAGNYGGRAQGRGGARGCARLSNLAQAMDRGAPLRRESRQRSPGGRRPEAAPSSASRPKMHDRRADVSRGLSRCNSRTARQG